MKACRPQSCDPPEPSPALRGAAASGCNDSFRSLLEAWEPSIRATARRAIASRYAKTGHESTPDLQRDLAQAGRLALWRAVAGFNPSTGHPFVHYARRAIKNAVQKELGRPSTSSAIYLSPEAEQGDPSGQARRNFEQAERGILVAGWLRSLPQVLHRIYELLYKEGLSQRQIAGQLGVSQPRISQLHKRLLAQGARHFAIAIN